MSCDTSCNDFEDQLATALVTRPVIEQAKGMLALVRSVTPDQAFIELRHVARTHNVILRELAGALVDAASGRASDDAQLRKVVWHEWGSVLPHR